MRVKNIASFRTFYKEKVRGISDASRDENFIGHSIMDNNGNRIFGFFEIYHADKEDIDKFLTPFLDMAVDIQAIYEFLQNAYDSHSKTFILYNDDKYLLAFNDGEQFSFEGVRSILNIGQSTKDSRSNIGRFGVGFKISHRLVGEKNGITEIKNLKGPILFSWNKNEDLKSFLSLNDCSELIPTEFEVYEENGSFKCKDDEAWLFKILLTNFPAYIGEKIKDLNYHETTDHFTENELKEFIQFANKILSQGKFDINQYKSGSMVFVPLGPNKAERINDKRLITGLEYSLIILNKISTRNTLLQNVYIFDIEKPFETGGINFIELSIDTEKELTDKEKEAITDTNTRQEIIDFLIGYPKDYEQVNFKGSPNFYLYFPLSDELHGYNFIIHSSYFKNLSQRTSLDEGKKNEVLLELLSKKIKEKFEDQINNIRNEVNNLIEYKQFFPAILLSDWTPNARNKKIFDILMQPLIEYIKEKVPTTENSYEPLKRVKIKNTKLDIKPIDFAVKDYKWFYDDTPLIVKEAQEAQKLNIKKTDIIDLINDSQDFQIINQWLDRNSNLISELIDEINSINSPKSFKGNFDHIKIYKFSDNKYYSIDDIEKDISLHILDSTLKDLYDFLIKHDIKIHLLQYNESNIISRLSNYLYDKFSYLNKPIKYTEFLCSVLSTKKTEISINDVIILLLFFVNLNYKFFEKYLLVKRNGKYVIEEKLDRFNYYHANESDHIHKYIRKHHGEKLYNIESEIHEIITDNSSGILKGDELYNYLIENDPDYEELLPIITYANRAIKEKFLEKIPALKLSETKKSYENTYEQKVIKLAMDIEFIQLIEKIQIESSAGEIYPISISTYKDKVIFTFNNNSYILSLIDILPKYKKTTGLLLKIIWRFGLKMESDLKEFFKVNKELSLNDIYSELSELENLDNAQQLAFITLYTAIENSFEEYRFKIFNYNNEKVPLIRNTYYIQSRNFIDKNHILNKKYLGLEEILKLNKDNCELDTKYFKIAIYPYIKEETYFCQPLSDELKNQESLKKELLLDLSKQFKNLLSIESNFENNKLPNRVFIENCREDNEYKGILGFIPQKIILDELYSIQEEPEKLPDWVRDPNKKSTERFSRHQSNYITDEFLEFLGANSENSNPVKFRKQLINEQNEGADEIKEISEEFTDDFLERTLKWLQMTNKKIKIDSPGYKLLEKIYEKLNFNIDFIPVFSNSDVNSIEIYSSNNDKQIYGFDYKKCYEIEEIKVAFDQEFRKALLDGCNQKIIDLNICRPHISYTDLTIESKIDKDEADEMDTLFYRKWKEKYNIEYKIYKIRSLTYIPYSIYIKELNLKLKTISSEEEIAKDSDGNIYFIKPESNLEILCKKYFVSEDIENKKLDLLFELKSKENDLIHEELDKEFDPLDDLTYDKIINDLHEPLDFPANEYKSFEEKLIELLNKYGRGNKYAGYIYHFTHIENAVAILKAQKILSRNRATFKNSAGISFINTTNDEIKNFVRFYFRPKTPTQYYNEFLGKKTKYGDLPQCPVPIFFKFKIQEVFEKCTKEYYISNGNLRHYPRFKYGNTYDFLKEFNFKYLYKVFGECDLEKYLNASQQEFIVKEEFDFSNLKDVIIICPFQYAKDTLVQLLKDDADKFSDKIIVNEDFYYKNNWFIKIKRENEFIILNTVNLDPFTDFNDKHIIELDLFPKNAQMGSKISIKCPLINRELKIIKKDLEKIEVHYNNLESKQNWLIYAD